MFVGLSSLGFWVLQTMVRADVPLLLIFIFSDMFLVGLYGELQKFLPDIVKFFKDPYLFVRECVVKGLLALTNHRAYWNFFPFDLDFLNCACR